MFQFVLWNHQHVVHIATECHIYQEINRNKNSNKALHNTCVLAIKYSLSYFHIRVINFSIKQFTTNNFKYVLPVILRDPLFIMIFLGNVTFDYRFFLIKLKYIHCFLMSNTLGSLLFRYLQDIKYIASMIFVLILFHEH